MKPCRTTLALFACAAITAGAASASPTAADQRIPRYTHVFVIVEENKGAAEIDGSVAPTITRLAKTYGSASEFYAEVHPSEANYVAMLGGDTFGIHDDDGFFCKPGQDDPRCPKAKTAGYVNHTLEAPSLGTQLAAAGLSWKGYYESIPAAGSLVTQAAAPTQNGGPPIPALYASKHSGFLNFKAVQDDPQRADHIVGFDQLDTDLASGALPAFALVVPNQCNEMHGTHGPAVPADCNGANGAQLIGRGDAMVGTLVGKIQASAAWSSADNVAIVITWDEAHGTRDGCCGNEPSSAANYGGGHIPTIVVTNHGPRGVTDPTPYNHYSLLRTLEDAFGIHTYLRHADDTANGVVPMEPLFRTAPTQ